LETGEAHSYLGAWLRNLLKLRLLNIGGAIVKNKLITVKEAIKLGVIWNHRVGTSRYWYATGKGDEIYGTARAALLAHAAWVIESKATGYKIYRISEQRSGSKPVQEFGRITLPKGKTANERAKDRAQDAIADRATNQVLGRHTITIAEQRSGKPVQEAAAKLANEVGKRSLADVLNPRQYGFSPKMSAIIGAILGHDYGVRDGRGNHIVGLSITSDGFVLGSTVPLSSGAFVGDVADLERNLAFLLEDAKLSPQERAEYDKLYAARVQDWRS
jgi:hypothetical protein